ncbi:F-box/kelch-repeat protein At5g42350-like [Triticum dicoccoides]|uniref:F-box/kelch-repeat protein At5g42350-like n=1 Tax=Triticum dicoccoides TaxID=85692 RepID=UPI000E7A0FAD|nr:F-box/kelch-repeat protein At5g42350-like [Triticum dicoccoides]
MSGAAALRRSGSNSLSALLRAEDDDPGALAATKRRDGGGRRGRSGGRRSCLRLPLGGAGGCRVCACDEVDPAPRRRAPADGDGDGEAEAGGEEQRVPAALQCFSWKKGPAAVARIGRALRVEDDAVAEDAAPSLTALPDDVLEMVLSRLPLASLLAARCVCRRWRDLTVAPQLLRLRREGPRAATTPWLFLFGVEADGGWGASAAATAVHALDVAAHRWRRVGAAPLKGRFLFSVAGVGDELYAVGGRSGGSSAGSVKTKTHKGVMVFSPLTGAWRKTSPMRAARSRPVLGVFVMSASRSIVHARAEKHVRRANAGAKFRLGGTSAVYEDPHRLSLRRLRLRDVLNEDTDPTVPAHGHGKASRQQKQPAQARQALIAVGGRGPWDEPLVSGEIYDPVTDKWVEIAGFPTDVGLACSGAVCGDMFYVYCESDTVVAYHLDACSWSVVQTSRPPPRLRDYTPALVCCASRLFMLCVSWCDPANRRDKVVRKVFELNLGSTPLLHWTEASAHPDAPMDSNAVFAAGQDRIYAVEMFRIFGKVLDFATACRVSGGEQSWSRIARENAAAEADAMSCRLKSMAVLLL